MIVNRLLAITRLDAERFGVVTEDRRDDNMRLAGNELRPIQLRGVIEPGRPIRVVLGPVTLPIVEGLAVGQTLDCLTREVREGSDTHNFCVYCGKGTTNPNNGHGEAECDDCRGRAAAITRDVHDGLNPKPAVRKRREW